MDTKGDAYLFLFSNTIIILFAGYISFTVRNIIREKKGKTPFDVDDFIRNSVGSVIDTDLTSKTILDNLHSMAFGYIQGAISVMGLLFGLHYLRVLMPKNKMVKIGLGETYGNVFSVILGVLGEHTFRSYYGEHTAALWTDPLGALLGGLTIIGIVYVMHLHIRILD